MLHHHEHLDLARRHLLAAETRIARQRALVAELNARGYSTDLARDLLRALIETERQMRTHYEFLRREDRES